MLQAFETSEPAGGFPNKCWLHNGMNVVSIEQMSFRVVTAINSRIWPFNTCSAAFWSTKSWTKQVETQAGQSCHSQANQGLPYMHHTCAKLILDLNHQRKQAYSIRPISPTYP